MRAEGAGKAVALVGEPAGLPCISHTVGYSETELVAIGGAAVSERDGKMIDYIVVVVSEYAEHCAISVADAFARLYASGGIDALVENYDIEHTLPLMSTIDGLDALVARSDVAA